MRGIYKRVTGCWIPGRHRYSVENLKYRVAFQVMFTHVFLMCACTLYKVPVLVNREWVVNYGDPFS